MPAAIRKNDLDSQGHKVSSRVAATVKIDNLPAALQTSMMNNGETIVAGSLSVFIEHKPAARKGDKTNNGHILIKGSSDVIIG